MLSKLQIDINADVGEGIGNEDLLMPYLSSCNIACGGHAGDESTMKSVVELAKQYQVKIGAHPSFPDRKNFGRIVMDVAHDVLLDSLKTQLKTLLAICNSKGIRINHVKPHGALYNLAVYDEVIAEVILNSLSVFSYNIKLYAPQQSVIAKLASSRNIEVVYEGFADRNYNDDLSLVSRLQPSALITERDAVFDHVYRMIKQQHVKTITGAEKAIKVDTICVHGDTKNAIELVQYLQVHLKSKNIKIL